MSLRIRLVEAIDGLTASWLKGIDGAVLVSNGALAFKQDDTTSATYTYFGEAVPGTASSTASWRISRMTNADSTIEWADGDGKFDNVWDDRASLSYS